MEPPRSEKKHRFTWSEFVLLALVLGLFILTAFLHGRLDACHEILTEVGVL